MAAGPVDEAARWDARFAAATGFVSGRAPNAWLAQQAAVFALGAPVLCVADGKGRNSVVLAQAGLRAEDFDVSPVVVAKARQINQ